LGEESGKNEKKVNHLNPLKRKTLCSKIFSPRYNYKFACAGIIETSAGEERHVSV